MVLGCEVMVDIDGALLARQRPDVTVGGEDFVALAEKFFDGFRFRL